MTYQEQHQLALGSTGLDWRGRNGIAGIGTAAPDLDRLGIIGIGRRGSNGTEATATDWDGGECQRSEPHGSQRMALCGAARSGSIGTAAEAGKRRDMDGRVPDRLGSKHLASLGAARVGSERNGAAATDRIVSDRKRPQWLAAEAPERQSAHGLHRIARARIG